MFFKNIFTIVKIRYILLLLLLFNTLNNNVFAVSIDWDCITNNRDWCIITNNKKEIKKNNTINIKKNEVSKDIHSVNILTNFNKWYIDKYKENLDKIKKIRDKIYIEKNKEKDKQNQILMAQFQQYIKIENNVNKADYILLIKYNLKNITFFNYKGQTYLFYLYPFVLTKWENIQNQKVENVKLSLQSELQTLLTYNNLNEIEKKIKEIKSKYKLNTFYKIMKLSDIYKYNILKIGRISQSKININIPDLSVYNTLYYIPKKIEKEIDDKYIYFYIPIKKTDIEWLEQSQIKKEDFNKFYCVNYQYNDNFYFLNKTICDLYKNTDKNWFIKIDLSDSLNKIVYKVNISRRWKEFIDIWIMLFWIIFAFIIYFSVRHLRKKKYQYENEKI